MLVFSLAVTGLKPASYVALRDATREMGLLRNSGPTDRLILETCRHKTALTGHPRDWIQLVTGGLGDRGFSPAHCDDLFGAVKEKVQKYLE